MEVLESRTSGGAFDKSIIRQRGPVWGRFPIYQMGGCTFLSAPHTEIHRSQDLPTSNFVGANRGTRSAPYFSPQPAQIFKDQNNPGFFPTTQSGVCFALFCFVSTCALD